VKVWHALAILLAIYLFIPVRWGRLLTIGLLVGLIWPLAW
jgi:hypothetical protein